MDIVEEIINDEKDAKRVYYFRKFLFPIIALAAVIAIVIACYSYYGSRKEEHSKKVGDVFAGVMAGKVVEPIVVEESLKNIIDDSDTRVAELVKIKLIQDNISKGNIDNAKEQLLKVMEDKYALEMTRSYAHILFISVILDQDNITDSDQLQISNLLHYFDNTKMFYSSSQLLKALFHFRIKQYELAEKTANEIIMMPDVPTIIKDQASALVVMIKYQK